MNKLSIISTAVALALSASQAFAGDTASQSQSGTNNNASIDQVTFTGDGRTAYQSQYGNDNTATAIQEGTSQFSQQIQTGPSSNNTVSIDQSGSGNSSKQFQG